MTAGPDPNILLAYDFGLRRIGVATANLLTGTAAPLKTLRVGSRLPWDELDGVVDEWKPARLIVGLPDPQRAPAVSLSAGRFADELEHRYRLPVARLDESLTSRAAESLLRQRRASGLMKRRIDKAHIDSLAACLIAEQWMRAGLDDGTSGPGQPVSAERAD